MINFFRKTRRKLADNNQFFKYSRYAIGEIVLVAVGILIALQINNWNEEKKDRRKEFIALTNLKTEFGLNKLRLKEHTDFNSDELQRARDYSNRLMVGEITKFSDIWKNGFATRFNTYDPVSGVINSLISTGKIDMITNDSLKNLLSNWQVIVVDYKEEEIWDREFVLNQWIPYIVKHFPNKYQGLPEFQGLPADTLFLDSTMKNIYLEKIKNVEYLNLVGRNVFHKTLLLNDLPLLEESLNSIIRLIDEELEKWK